MKTILIVGMVAILPALAQSPDDLIAQRVYWGGSGPAVIVKNAPYSADAVTETTQTLSDGNHIVQRATQKLYRDSDGRERREESVLAVGALAQTNAPRVITISDPIDNVSYTLRPQDKTARRSTGLGPTLAIGNLGSGGQISWTTATSYAVSAAGNILTIAGGGQAAGGPGVKDDLGSKNIEGVIAKGTRTTRTIPAGQIGNELPINIVDEVWFSPELQMDVMTTHNDPRSSSVVYKVTNINRANPARTLFEPPSDYTVTGPAGAGRGRGAGPQK